MKHTHTRNLEREHEIERRIKCHGHNGSCKKAHPPKVVDYGLPPEETFWSKLLIKLKSWL